MGIFLSTPKTHTMNDIKEIVAAFALENPETYEAWVAIEGEPRGEDGELRDVHRIVRAFLIANYERDNDLALSWAFMDMRTCVRIQHGFKV